MAGSTLASVSAAKAALMEARSLDDVLSIRDKAEAIRVYAKTAGESLAAQNAAAEIKLRAERKAGELLAKGSKAKGGRPSKTGTSVVPVSYADVGITKNQASRWQKEAAVSPDKFEAWVATCQEEDKELTQAGLLKLAGAGHVAEATGEIEWYTPPEYVEAARQAMGGIDVDPASSDVAQLTVGADVYYTVADDGLSHEWTGRVWMNPPYSKELCQPFVEKLVESYKAGAVTSACVLVNNATETAWGQLLLSACSAACFVAGRIRFLDKTGRPANSPLQGQMVAYFGKDAKAFSAAYRDIGTVLRK